jgi:glucose dehydrogenase
MASMLNAQADWPGYGRGKEAQRFSPLTQINAKNVSKLVPAWTFPMQREGVPFRPSQSIPLVVNGIMYLSWPVNHVAAMESETGKIIWEFVARSNLSGREGSMRSIEYWPGDAQSPPEILFATEEAELIALNEAL